MHGARSQKVPQTDTTLTSSKLGPVNRLVLWREHVVQVGISPTTIENLPILQVDHSEEFRVSWAEKLAYRLIDNARSKYW